MSNPFVWFDHHSDDPTGASGFYARLLGWTPAAQSPPGFKAFGQGRTFVTNGPMIEFTVDGALPGVERYPHRRLLLESGRLVLDRRPDALPNVPSQAARRLS